MYTMTDEPHRRTLDSSSLSFHNKWDKSSWGGGLLKAVRLRLTTLQVQTESNR